MLLRPSPSARMPAARAAGSRGRRLGKPLSLALGLLLGLAGPLAAEGQPPPQAEALPQQGHPAQAEPQEGAGSEAAVWWLARRGAVLGPYSAADLDELAHTDGLTARSFLWRDGMAGWARLEEVDELATILRIVEIATLLRGSWEIKGPIAVGTGEGVETLHVTLRLNFRRDGGFAWSDTAYRPANGQTGSSFHSGPYYIEPRADGAFRLLLRREDVDSDWEVRVLSGDRLEVITLGLEARRL